MKTGILIINLGTPDSPSTADVRKYLREFLSDPRVIDLKPAARWSLVNFIISPIRAPKSAKLYQQIWNENGSPLLYYSVRQKELLQQRLGSEYVVEMGMRYQSPSIEDALKKFNSPAFTKIKVIPLFPQYASASTGSVQEKVMNIISKWEVIPHVEFISYLYNQESFIKAFAEIGKKYDPLGYDHILMSFHGLPERQIRKSDCFDYCLKENCCASIGEKNAFCYRAQCYETARRLATQLQLPFEKYTVCFQSRLSATGGWIQPFTDHILKERAEKGDKKLLIFAPAFVSDCLETIYEIGVEYDVLFKKLGGEKVQLVESLNDHPLWIDALEKISLN